MNLPYFTFMCVERSVLTFCGKLCVCVCVCAKKEQGKTISMCVLYTRMEDGDNGDTVTTMIIF